MIKKLISMLLTVALTLSIVTVVAPTAKADPEPTPTQAQSQEQLPNYVKFEGTEEFEIKVEESSTSYINLEYSLDETEWNEYETFFTREIISSGENKVVYFRGSDNYSLSDNYFVITPSNSGTVAASGNIMALLDYESPATTLSYMNRETFAGLFKNCTALTSSPSLPATTLSERCYREMFYGCTSLTQAPELPAETLTDYCYEKMFYGCTGLTEAPELPAETLAYNCYENMFYGCTGLTEAPELPAETLVEACYRQMFQNCTGLTETPSLPAETLARQCYEEMFIGCTGLTEMSELPAETLAYCCYTNMFSGCTSLTKALELPATTLIGQCYQGMFNGCTSLNEAPSLPAENIASSCYNSMFSGCTGLTEAPELPAETLAPSCYISMFSGCTGLTKAPELKATTLASYCYAYMFQGCTNLSMEETTDSSKALWVMPSSTEATSWNKDTLKNTAGSATSIELGKMYKSAASAIYTVDSTEYYSAADLNADIVSGTVAAGSTIVLTGEKPDGTIVINGKNMTIDGSALATGIVLPDNGVLVSVTNKAKVNVLGTMPKTDNDGTANAPIYSEGFIYLGASSSITALTTTGSVYQAKTVANFDKIGATLTDAIDITVTAEVALKTGDTIKIDAKEGDVGLTTYNQETKRYQATIRNIYLTHIGNDLGLSVKANDTAVETLKNYTTVDYLSAAAKVEGKDAPTDAMKTLLANLIIACKYMNDAGEGSKGAVIDLSAIGLEWIDSAKTTTQPAKSEMSIDESKEDIRFAAAGIHVTEKLNLFVEIVPKGDTLKIVPGGTSVRAYIKNGDEYEPLAVTDDMVVTQINTQWFAYIQKLAPTQFGSDIKIELVTNLFATAQTLHYSVNTYCYKMYEQYPDLCTAIYNYGTAAKAVVAPQ